MTKLKNSNCAKLKKLNCDNSKTQIVMVIKMTVVIEVVIMTSFSKKHLNTLTTDQLSGQLFATFAMFFLFGIASLTDSLTATDLTVCNCFESLYFSEQAMFVPYRPLFYDEFIFFMEQKN